jgi:hypothetical protein
VWSLRVVVVVHKVPSTAVSKMGQAKRLFQYRFPEPLWNNIRNFVRNIGKLPMWINHDMSITVFGGKSNTSVWQTIFEKGSSPQGQQVLSEPLNLIKLIQA